MTQPTVPGAPRNIGTLDATERQRLDKELSDAKKKLFGVDYADKMRAEALPVGIDSTAIQAAGIELIDATDQQDLKRNALVDTIFLHVARNVVQISIDTHPAGTGLDVIFGDAARIINNLLAPAASNYVDINDTLNTILRAVEAARNARAATAGRTQVIDATAGAAAAATTAVDTPATPALRAASGLEREYVAEYNAALKDAKGNLFGRGWKKEFDNHAITKLLGANGLINQEIENAAVELAMARVDRPLDEDLREAKEDALAVCMLTYIAEVLIRNLIRLNPGEKLGILRGAVWSTFEELLSKGTLSNEIDTSAIIDPIISRLGGAAATCKDIPAELLNTLKAPEASAKAATAKLPGNILTRNPNTTGLLAVTLAAGVGAGLYIRGNMQETAAIQKAAKGHAFAAMMDTGSDRISGIRLENEPHIELDPAKSAPHKDGAITEPMTASRIAGVERTRDGSIVMRTTDKQIFISTKPFHTSYLKDTVVAFDTVTEKDLAARHDLPDMNRNTTGAPEFFLDIGDRTNPSDDRLVCDNCDPYYARNNAWLEAFSRDNLNHNGTKQLPAGCDMPDAEPGEMFAVVCTTGELAGTVVSIPEDMKRAYQNGRSVPALYYTHTKTK